MDREDTSLRSKLVFLKKRTKKDNNKNKKPFTLDGILLQMGETSEVWEDCYL